MKKNKTLVSKTTKTVQKPLNNWSKPNVKDYKISDYTLNGGPSGAEGQSGKAKSS